MKTNLFLFAAVCFYFSGCAKSDPQTDADANPGAVATEDGSDAHDIAHPEHGPHEGELIELGKEAFHAELVHGDDDALSIFVLDSSATKTVPIAAEKLVLSLKNEEEVKAFDLTAKPDGSDPVGLSSQFVSADPLLHQWLDNGAEGKLMIEIEGKSYNGDVAHDHSSHDHSGHDH
jgi:hypothetical protein